MWIFIGALAAASVYGCSQHYLLEDDQGNVLGTEEQKYRVLSFFFDGVPPPVKESGQEPGEEASKTTAVRQRFTAHGPYAARFCDACHLRGSNKLLMPVEELCLNCHTLSTAKKKLHGPLAAGSCNVCHDPHGSSYRYLLVSDSKTFCYHCHNQSDVMRRPVHQGTDLECTMCHDAHAADSEFLLK
ncbi:MAG: cytochrome c3 family protein [Nitrospirota bacterium]